jgi:hypothetical protein
VGSRERRRAERRKRKDRSAARSPENGDQPAAPAPAPRERMARGYARSEEKNRQAREALDPLHEGERPLVVTVGAILSGIVCLSIVVAYAAGVEVNGKQPAFVQAASPALLMGIMAWGMWRARYWAVLGFQVILLFLIFSAAVGLAVQAGSVTQVLATLGLLAFSGTFFYLMVKAMARIQMPTRIPRE